MESTAARPTQLVLLPFSCPFLSLSLMPPLLPSRADPPSLPLILPDGTGFKFGYLTKQNALWSTLGVNGLFGGKKFSPAELVQDSDELLVVAYPSFNPREELSATATLWREAGEPASR